MIRVRDVSMGLRFLCVFALWILPIQGAGRESFSRNSSSSPLPSSVNVGALFTYDSFIGRAAKLAFMVAIDDVNADQSILRGTKLNIVFQDANCSGFVGTMGGTFRRLYQACLVMPESCLRKCPNEPLVKIFVLHMDCFFKMRK